MLKNYLNIAIRNLLRHRIYSVLNLAGLGVGLATSMLIFIWVRDELSFDRFHSNAAEIYRVTVDVSGVKVAPTPAPLAEAIKSEIPEVAAVSQIAYTTRLLSIGDQSFEESKVFFADDSFLSMFDFPLLKGDRKTALSQPDGVLLTEDMAIKYFGRSEPMGKIIEMDGKYSFIVKGVLKNLPSHSHLQFGILLPFEFLKQTEDYKNTVGWDYYTNIYTYLRIHSNVASNSAVIKKIAGDINQIYARQKMEMKADFRIQPLEDIHLKSDNMMADMTVRADARYVTIFSIVAIFIIVVAAINFMNLATARAARRGREIGMRKVLGAQPKQLVGQFLGESLLVSAIASIIAIALVVTALPAFNDLTEKNLQLPFDGGAILQFLSIVVITGLLAGSYPAVYQTSFPTVKALRGLLKGGPKSLAFRNVLVMFQFVVTIVLIVSTIVVYQQVQFIRNQNLGFDKENIIYAQMKSDMYPRYTTVRSKLEASAVLNNFTIVSDLPTNNGSATYDVKWEGKDVGQQMIFPLIYIDEHYVSTMGMKVLHGRSFSGEFKADTSNYVVNETALKIMNMEPSTAIGKPLTVNGEPGQIIGVVKDFHFKSLMQPIEPLIMQLNDFGGFILVKTNEADLQAKVEELKNIFRELSPSYPFEYSFLEKDFATLYRTETKISAISSLFAGLSILIACLGLFGLSAFLVEQRFKEIGVRKVVGATVGSLIVLMSQGFLRPLFLSMVLATPLSWYLMTRWLSEYAYHVNISAWVFLIASILVFILAMLITCFQTTKAAMINPAKSLRSE